jgi:uncharacterized protein (TIGR02246 family)
MTNSIDMVVKKLDEAWNCCDLEETLTFYAEDATVVIEPGKIIKGKATIRKAFQYAMSLNVKASQLKTNIIETEDTALFISKWVSEWGVDGHINSRENIATTVFTQDKHGDWKIVIDNPFGPAVLSF